MNKTARAHFVHGFDLAREGKWSKAIKMINKGLALEPNDYAGIMNRCTCYAMLDCFAESLADADRLIELKPDDWHGYHLRGNILSEMGCHDEANEAYKDADLKRRSQKGND